MDQGVPVNNNQPFFFSFIHILNPIKKPLFEKEGMAKIILDSLFWSLNTFPLCIAMAGIGVKLGAIRAYGPLTALMILTSPAASLTLRIAVRINIAFPIWIYLAHACFAFTILIDSRNTIITFAAEILRT